MIEISERRVLVVGASSGVGRDLGQDLARRGAHVGFAARRVELVEAAALAAGERGIALTCDVKDDASCESVVADAARTLGGLDTLIYAAAVGSLASLVECDGPVWRDLLDINLVGASLVTRAALPHLAESGYGRAIYLSSDSASTTPPWPGLGPYATSKAALERMVECWGCEYPEVRFSSVILGPTVSHNDAPRSFTAEWEPDELGKWAERWISLGLVSGQVMDSGDVCKQIAAILTTSGGVARVVLEP